MGTGVRETNWIWSLFVFAWAVLVSINSRAFKLLIYFVACLHISGCQSFIAHDAHGPGYVYHGVNTDLFLIKCFWSSAIIPEEDESRLGWAALALITTPLFLVDVPFSFVLDTALLPSDLATEGDPKYRVSLLNDCEKFHHPPE